MCNGKDISIYKDKWIPKLTTFKIILLLELDKNAKVQNLISASGEWDVQKIKQTFIAEDTSAILKIPM